MLFSAKVRNIGRFDEKNLNIGVCFGLTTFNNTFDSLGNCLWNIADPSKRILFNKVPRRKEQTVDFLTFPKMVQCKTSQHFENIII
jgi:hypothetical protein